MRKKGQGSRVQGPGAHSGRKKATVTLAVIILLISGCAWIAAAGTDIVSSKELIENARALDYKVVTYKGELITAIMGRGEHSWINLNDGVNAIGVWCKSRAVEPVKFIGDYKNKGDVLEIEGVFHRACSEHGGELDIHADRVKIVEAGYSMQERINPKRVNASIALFIFILLAVVMWRKRI